MSYLKAPVPLLMWSWERVYLLRVPVMMEGAAQYGMPLTEIRTGPTAYSTSSLDLSTRQDSCKAKQRPCQKLA